jgi:hypothetical protein
MIVTAVLTSAHVDKKTLFNRCAHVMAVWRGEGRLGALPRALSSSERPAAEGAICARNRALGVKVPWYRVKFIRGKGTSVAKRAMRSSGSKITCVVPRDAGSSMRSEHSPGE